MAARTLFSSAAVLPRLFTAQSTASSSTVSTLFQWRVLSAGVAIPPAFNLNVPDILSGIWDSILRAVPKKKTSHMKKRHRQMAGKALKDVTSINKCSGCGQPKRAHLLCPYCVNEIRQKWAATAKEANP